MDSKTVDKVWAYFIVEADGTESEMTCATDKTEFEMIFTDFDTAQAFVPYAQEAATSEGCTIKLVEFTVRREVRTFAPIKRAPRKPKRGMQ